MVDPVGDVGEMGVVLEVLVLVEFVAVVESVDDGARSLCSESSCCCLRRDSGTCAD